MLWRYPTIFYSLFEFYILILCSSKLNLHENMDFRTFCITDVYLI